MNPIELVLTAICMVAPFYMCAVRKARRKDLNRIADKYNEQMKDGCLGGIE